MSRYRKVPVRLWGDRDFKKLSRPPANGQSLFLYLYTGPLTTALPGVVPMGEAAIAEALGWLIQDLRASWKELEQSGMAKADWDAPLVFLPGVIQDNKPESPNVVIGGWRPAFDELPDSDLKAEILVHFREYLQTQHSGFMKAFRETFPEAFPQGLPEAIAEALPEGRGKPSPNPSPNQEQEQEHEQEHDHEHEQEHEEERVQPAVKSSAEPKASRADARVDVSFTEFAEKFKARGRVEYGYRKGDFVQLADLRRRLGVEAKTVIPDWTRAVQNYLATPQSRYTLADLCSRFDVFRGSALDRYGKPADNTNGRPVATSRRVPWKPKGATRNWK